MSCIFSSDLVGDLAFKIGIFHELSVVCVSQETNQRFGKGVGGRGLAMPNLNT